ncbi:DUF3224 domain-containing protein [Bowmanella sp. Y26]|uniref:DUF3224 domain-containing protein n=1 Tax=Bowmanella yangjiangensis TaxID=2811230 RepID=UPI001BDC1BBB|nr:DUF3224 domain-containing protein [Bowmanella yangjiangensis]MBT1063633.1 DUF3224 domain-containing protein [Bowmanella yangjiangensis]
MQARGEFEVRVQSLPSYTQGKEGVSLGRMSIDKIFSGDLEGKSKGEMLSAKNTDKSSAGYVAIEQISGTLGGREGSFVMQHYGTMQGANQHLVLEVLPHSATGELQGLTGRMLINITSGRHSYVFDYRLPDTDAEITYPE